jgi:hypothetical protein
MKTSRYTEAQIIAILRQNCAKPSIASMISASAWSPKMA